MRRLVLLVLLASLVAPAAASAATQTITVRVWHTRVSAALIQTWERAEIRQDVRLRRYYPSTPTIRFGSGGWPLTIEPLTDLPANDAGYHWPPVAGGTPTMSVARFAGTSSILHGRFYPYWEYVASHELLETLVDPDGYSREICDPVGDFAYLIGGAAVAAFVTPNGRYVGSYHGGTKALP